MIGYKSSVVIATGADINDASSSVLKDMAVCNNEYTPLFLNSTSLLVVSFKLSSIFLTMTSVLFIDSPIWLIDLLKSSMLYPMSLYIEEIEFIYPLTASISWEIVENKDESIRELCPIVLLSSLSIARSPSNVPEISGLIPFAVSALVCAVVIMFDRAESTLSKVTTCVLITWNLAISISISELFIESEPDSNVESALFLSPIFSATSADFMIASVNVLMNVALTCCWTAVFALSVIFGAMAFFFWFV